MITCPEVKPNFAVLTGGTNFTDSTVDLARANSYRVRPVVDGVEQAPSGAFTMTANHAVEPVVRVPLRAGGPVKFVWVGDLDGEYDFDGRAEVAVRITNGGPAWSRS